MRTVVVRKLPEEVYVAMSARAKANGNSLETELRSVLREVAAPSHTITDQLLHIGSFVCRTHAVSSGAEATQLEALSQESLVVNFS
ncbi:MAG: FitA-like ribbon-helix-helix domain-containing protein [Casimicrobium sp.]